MNKRRVIGSELIEDARQRGRTVFELFPEDILTSMAEETAMRIGMQLVIGPLEKPNPPVTDGVTALRRGLYRRSPKWVTPKPTKSLRARRLRKLALVGAGGVGANIAHLAANKDIADEIALIDIVPGAAEAAALDLNHASGINGTKAKCVGGTDLALVSGADVIVVTAGRARQPGMTRADLIDVNTRVIRNTADVIKTQAPDAIVIVVTNPLDEMTVEMLRATGFARERVLGMAGTLDSSRFRNSLAQAAGVTPADVTAITLGSHGDEMAPILSQARIKGRQVEAFLSSKQITECVKDTITGGGQVVALKKTGSATVAPAHATVELLDHIRGAKTGPVPVSVMLEGEYGIENVVLGVPAYLGKAGLISVEDLKLTDDERAALHSAADAIRLRLGL